jgi:asparagine synthase (glutamine-hydrolysing)
MAGSESWGAEALIDQLDDLLRDAVGLRMEADVPLGAFLSGGYDSSAVVAQMQAQRSQPVRTFSIGFTESGFNEAEHAAAVARHLGTAHNELYVTPDEAMGVIPSLPTIYDEPFADSSQIPTYLVSRLARSQVTVSLSGDGGDELFAGYNRHVMGPRLWNRLRRLPRPMRQAVAASLTLALRSRHLTSSTRIPLLGEKLEKLRDALGAADGMDFYHRLRAVWHDPAALVPGANASGSIPVQNAAPPDGLGLREQMILADMQNYLPDDILTKIDRASMAVSLEARVPMLDHRLVEFAWGIPDRYKVRDGQGKWLLRQMLYRYVPKALLDRPKAGFAVPLGDWLRGPLRDWAEALLDEERLRQQGYLDPALVRECWAEHLAGHRHGHARIWHILMFQAWLEENA